MTPLEMIAEWHKGCSCAPAGKPEECPSCARGLIDALEAKLGGPDRRAISFAGLDGVVSVRLGDKTIFDTTGES